VEGSDCASERIEDHRGQLVRAHGRRARRLEPEGGPDRDRRAPWTRRLIRWRDEAQSQL
jgi:hypothetical protein